ncbi:5'/3'-nucleotidase SurE [Halonotius terrestris]|uniref:5'-nucleotidase SurE n=1 Tax=Halonotius terrestris TaxID=2487750 RepID=A0A8J8PD87_9EURY|nr:5'/3'-nucleotidase SurE [Halonotius terrestris]TQQ83082.1 5'/3'-nucleotidase SurE [Halonotius terrestris]
MDAPRILLTNDDGIDSVGFRALYEGLSTVGDVVAVAPADDQSAVGRTHSESVELVDHEFGYAVRGTPVDCVIAGLGSLCPDVDLVVSGCNKGANLGAYVLGRSGTVSAAVEAAFFGVPAISVSLYIEGGDDWASLATETTDFATARDATTYLVERATTDDVFDAADYLNVNVPFGDNPGVDGPLSMRVTRPSTRYEMNAERDPNGDITLTDGIWEQMRGDSVDDPVGTDRRAVADGEISVSPLTAPHSTERHDRLDEIAAGYMEGSEVDAE